MAGADPGTVAAYQAAVANGDTPLANYLAGAIASQAGININQNDVTAAPNSMVNPSPGYGATPSSQQGGFWSGLGNFPLLGGIAGTSPNAIMGDVTGAASAVGSVASGTASFFSFISDIPRVVTLLVGLIILVVGFFMLADKSVIQTVIKAAK